MLEAIVDGKYYWVPFSRIKEITLDPPSDLRDLVWAPAILTLSAGAQKVALLPVRYPGTEKSGAGPALLARKTDWADRGGIGVGIGQRVLATDAAETPCWKCAPSRSTRPRRGRPRPKRPRVRRLDMAELNPRDRLQPFLLDRLTDDAPGPPGNRGKKASCRPATPGRAAARSGVAPQHPAPTADEGLAEFANVAASVINFGVPDLTGLTASGVGVAALERDVLRAIQTFEPRLEKRSVSVRMLPTTKAPRPTRWPWKSAPSSSQSPARSAVSQDVRGPGVRPDCSKGPSHG